MKGETAERLVIGIAVVAAFGGLYNLATLPRGEEGGGLFATVRQAQEAFEWSVSASAVNSAVFLLVAAGLVILAVNAEFEE